jgi:hypothetical protein
VTTQDISGTQPAKSTPTRGRLVHWVFADEPYNGRRQKTACGLWLPRPTREVATDRDQVSCTDCQAELRAADAIEL